MAYLDELEKQSLTHHPAGFDVGLKPGDAYASYFPQWETQTPQYQQPNPYATAQQAFRQNEFVYSIIIKRAMAEAKGNFRVNDIRGKEPKEIKNHDLTRLIRHPNKNMTENDFWMIKRISQDIAGFAAFEIEYNMLGEPIHLWFIRPDWCSFIRGQKDPLKYIRYQPWGLPPVDIPLVDDSGRQRVLFFSNAEDFDPLFPGIRFFSPAMHALPQIQFDNAMTFFLHDFVQHGAKPSGLISVEQTIDEPTSEDYQRRWVERHGGADKWATPIVLGLGSKYQAIQMNFKDMAFGELDARFESRTCNVFQMETIVADARAGLDVSSYNNKEQATRNWFYGWVTDTWETNGEVMSTQMIPIYEDAPDNFSCDFDVSKVYAMQEDRTARWDRARGAWKDRIVKLNEARKEAGLEPIEGDEGEAFFSADAQPAQDVNAEVQPGAVAKLPPGEKEQPGQERPEQDIPSEDTTEKETANKRAVEMKAFKKFAANRLQEGKPATVVEFEWKHHSLAEQQVALLQIGIIPGAAQIIDGMRALLEKVG